MSSPVDIPEHLKSLIQQVDSLADNDLQLVNRYIEERAKSRNQDRRAALMASFNVGDSVSFEDKQGQQRQATILRVNKKTVSLLTDDDERWNVAPELLSTNVNTDTARLPASSGRPSLSSSSATVGSIGKAREWIGGSIEVPGFIADEGGDLYRPEMHIWLNEFGQVIGLTMIGRDEPSYDPVQFLSQTIANPKAGVPGAPSHVRVSDKTQAGQIQQAFPSINVSCAPTPELMEVQRSMTENMTDTAESTYSDIEVEANTLELFFKSTAALYRYKPWNHVHHDQCLIGVSIEELGIHNRVLSVIGQAGENFGFVLFDNLRDHEIYTHIGDYIRRDQAPVIPPHIALSFDKARDVSDELRKDISRNKWTVADSNAYPVLYAPEDKGFARPLGGKDIQLIYAIAQALPEALESVHLQYALRGLKQQTIKLRVHTAEKGFTVKLQAPYPYEEVMKVDGATDSLIADLLKLDRTSIDEPDWDKHHEITKQLETKYQQSIEAKSLNSDVGVSSIIMSMAFNYQSSTIATLSPGDLEEIIFGLIPGKVMLPPSAAQEIIDDTRAFYRFLQANYQLVQADACLDVLGGDAVQRLQTAMSDPSGFGIGKSVLTGDGTFNPFDDFPPPPLPSASATKPKPPSKINKKKKRASARKARKKNR